jgi:hypothetical protein
MTRYSVTNSEGSFVNSDIEGDKNEQPAASGDSTQAQPAVRPASQRHKAGKN